MFASRACAATARTSSSGAAESPPRNHPRSTESYRPRIRVLFQRPSGRPAWTSRRLSKRSSIGKPHRHHRYHHHQQQQQSKGLIKGSGSKDSRRSRGDERPRAIREPPQRPLHRRTRRRHYSRKVSACERTRGYNVMRAARLFCYNARLAALVDDSAHVYIMHRCVYV